ncbi:bifunctional Zinc finger [Babesia duncani]|uniref:RING-type E3 ubiquitin transferase n=1 Tax=Babesia duncani TaxID=323732 RepID=A0AAD9PKX0_9APIC|nr:bifunctional Zinc finger [Babesia duncani]
MNCVNLQGKSSVVGLRFACAYGVTIRIYKMTNAIGTDKVIKQILSIALRKNERSTSDGKSKTYIGHFYGRITGCSNVESVLLTANDLDVVLRAVIMVAILHNGNPLSSLNEIYARCSSIASDLKSDVVNPQHAHLLDYIGRDEFMDTLACIENALVSSGSLLLACPEFFDIRNVTIEGEIRKAYLDVGDSRVLWRRHLEFLLGPHSSAFVIGIIKGVFDSDTELAGAAIQCMFTEMFLLVRHIDLMPNAELRLLKELFQCREVIWIFVDLWTIKEVEGGISRLCGSMRELTTFWGRLLSPSPLNEDMINYGKKFKIAQVENAVCSRVRDFCGQQDVGVYRQVCASKRLELENYMISLVQVVKALVQYPGIRSKLLVGFGKLTRLNTNRRRVARLTSFNAPSMIFDPSYQSQLAFVPDNNFGFCINFTWLFLMLSRGIPWTKIQDLDPGFCQVSLVIQKLHPEAYNLPEAQMVKDMLGRLGNAPASMGDESQVLEAWKLLQKDVESVLKSKFITLIFYVTLEALGTLFVPVMHEYIKVIFHSVANASVPGLQRHQILDALSHVYVWRCALQNPALLEPLGYFINMSLALFVKSGLYYDKHGNPKNVPDNRNGYMSLLDSVCMDLGQLDGIPPQFAMLPVELIETSLELIKQLCILRHCGSLVRPFETNTLDSLDIEFVAATCIFLMRAPHQMIKNANLTCDLPSNVILYLVKHSGLVLVNYKIVHAHLVRALVECYINSQRVSFNFRVSCRMNLVQVLIGLFNSEGFKATFVEHVAAGNFTQYVHLLLSDVVFIFEELVTYLGEIKRRQEAGIDRDYPAPLGPQEPQEPQGHSREGQDESHEATVPSNDPTDQNIQEGSIDPNALKSMGFKDLKTKTQGLAEYFTELLTLVEITCVEFSAHVLKVPLLLTQVGTSLGCCLENLVGDASIHLKIKDMADFSFTPKQWLCKVVKCYLALHEHSSVGFQRAIIAEKGRYYKHSTLEKCFRILVREMCLSSAQRGKFRSLTQELHALATESDALESAMDSVPEEFLDPIMNDLMEDPVLLPSSGKVLDRKVIARHLMSEPTDPFTRAPLDIQDVVPQPELQARIAAFIASLQQPNGLI